jgi:hypothetical protein
MFVTAAFYVAGRRIRTSSISDLAAANNSGELTGPLVMAASFQQSSIPGP